MSESSAEVLKKIYILVSRIIVLTGVLLAVVFLFPYFRTVLVIFIVSWLLAILFGPVVDYFESVGIPRSLGVLLIILFFLIALGLSLGFLIPSLVRSIESIISKIQAGTVSELRLRIEDFFAKYFNKPELADEVFNKANQYILRTLSGLLGTLKDVGSFITTAVIIPFVTFFLIKDSRKFKKAIVSQIPNRYFELSLNVMYKIGDQVSRYLRGQAIDALLVGILSTLGLLIINIFLHNPVPYFVLVGMIAGFANLIPYLGPVVGAIPALVIAIITNPPNLLMVLVWIVVMFIVVQIIDNTMISPLVVSRSVNMHPLTVVAAVLIGGKVGGPLGMLFAVPIVGIFKVMLVELSWGLKKYRLS